MKKIILSLLAVIMIVGVIIAAEETLGITVKSMPPSVIRTAPRAGELEVDPELKEIKVKFSKDMMTEKMWSVCQISDETFPKTSGEIHYREDKRTCVIPVELEPDTTYAMWFNRGRFNTFRDTDNNPSVPYLLVFKTKKLAENTN